MKIITKSDENLLLVFSCMEGEEKNQAKAVWEARFQEKESLWIDVNPGDDTSTISGNLLDQVTDKDIGHKVENGSAVVALLMDLTGDFSLDTVRNVYRSVSELHDKYNCTVPIIMDFGYVGLLHKADKPQLRSRVKEVVACNEEDKFTRKLLCLVAPSALVRREKDKRWKAAFVYLDVLRRSNEPADIIPVAGGGGANDDIGFLRYGEFDPNAIYDLEKEIAGIETALGEGGTDVLKPAIAEIYASMEKRLLSRFDIDAGLQPQHPDLVVTGFFKKQAAKRGNNKEFNRAQRATQGALFVTGLKMKEDMDAFAADYLAGAPEKMTELLSMTGVGIGLTTNQGAMEEILKVPVSTKQDPVLPQFMYPENGYLQLTRAYLETLRESKIAAIKEAYGKALLQAYLEVDPNFFLEKQQQLSARLSEVKTEHSKLDTREKFVEGRRHRTGLLSAFTVAWDGGTGKSADVVLCRESQDREVLKEVCDNALFYIDKAKGSLKTLDAATMKALQLQVFDCTDAMLEEIIK